MNSGGIDLKAFFQREDVCQLLHDKHGVGWFDGGCLVAATAIGLFIKTGHLACIYARANEHSPRQPVHFCWVYGMFAFDADGACSRLSFPGRYARREGLIQPVIESVSKSKCARISRKHGIILDWGLSRRVAAMMREGVEGPRIS